MNKVLWSSFLGILILSVSIYSLFIIKNRVSNLREQIAEINRQLEEEKNNIYTLRAELAYLQSPERIKRLAYKYLNLKEISLAQIIDNPIYEENSQAIAAAASSQPKAVKWRYKKLPSKYFQTVSDHR